MCLLSYSISNFIAFNDWKTVILSKLSGIKIDKLGKYFTDLQNPIYVKSITSSNRIPDRILHHVLSKEERNEIKNIGKNYKIDATKQTKICLIAILVLQMMIYQENPKEESKWENMFYQTILPALRAHEKARMETLTKQEEFFLIAYVRAISYLNQIMTAANNKLLFINVAAMLEGSFKEYVTGGQNTPETERRELIFQLITKVEKRQRGPSAVRKTYKRNSNKKRLSVPVASSSFSISSSTSIGSPRENDHEWMMMTSDSEDERAMPQLTLPRVEFDSMDMDLNLEELDFLFDENPVVSAH